MSEEIKVLLVEDDIVDQMAYSRFVKREALPYETVIAGSIEEARAELDGGKFDVVLVDYFLGGETAIDLLNEVHDIPTIVITGLGDEEIAVNAMKLGAVDYLIKDAEGSYLTMLPSVIAHAIKLKQAENELVEYRENLEKMVIERTEKLTQTNQQLEDEIQERQRAENALMASEEHYRTFFEDFPIGVYRVTPGAEGQLILANKAYLNTFGFDSLEDFKNDACIADMYVNPAEREQFSDMLLAKGHVERVELQLKRKDGKPIWGAVTATVVHGKQGEIYFDCAMEDITEHKRAREKLEYLATHDPLTDLPNRVLFTDRLAHALAIANRSGEQGAIMMIDLDDFKAINDAFSHEEGDEFLKIIGERFKEHLRESDTVARIGGDEFAILLENTDQDQVSVVAQKLNRVLSIPVAIRGNAFITTASIGISLYPNDGRNVLQLLKNADLAMYQAKENKNSYQFYDRKMASRIEKEMELNTYLRYALQNNIFQLHYQPQVDSKTGKIIGLEALLRLPHPKKKWLSPMEFIPLAERTGMIIAIDEWVLRTAAKKMRELIHAGFSGLIMSVNLSSRQLNQPNLVDILKDVLRENDLNPASLELEISEGSIFQNTDQTIKIMSKLKALGVRLAIDDFGTGYASLNYLARFPLDTLKIDRSFTRRILSSKNVSAIVTGVIAIANNLGLSIVVEGVESKEQLSLFSGLGCHMIQGFFYSPAIAAEGLENLLRQGFSEYR